MKLNSNKGMYLEKIINATIKYYRENDIAIIDKLSIPIKIFEKTNNIIRGKLYLKSNVDYYGIYKGQFICIEAKQTNNNKFHLSYLLEQQANYMKDVLRHGGMSFLILYFNHANTFFKINYNLIEKHNLKVISLEWCYEYAIKLEIIFPGRLDFLN